MGNYVQKTLKLKPEKWARMIATEEHKALVMKFLERPSPVLLIIVLTHTAQLVAYSGFPLPQLKTKGEKVTRYTIDQFTRLGDVFAFFETFAKSVFLL